MFKKFAAVVLFALLPALALAQSSPGLLPGQVPSAQQWNSYFAKKMDYPPPNIGCIGCGTAAFANTGTAGHALGYLDGLNNYTANQNFNAGVLINGVTLSFPLSGALVGVTDAQSVSNKTLVAPVLSGSVTGTYTLVAPTIAGGGASALTKLGMRSTGSGPFDLTLANSENLTAGRTLTLAVGDAARLLTVAGNASVSGTNTGDQTITLTGSCTGSGTSTIAVTCSLTSLNGVAYPSSPSINTVPVVTSASSGGTVTYEAVPNAALANAAMTIAGHSIALGGTQTLAASDLTNGTSGSGAVCLVSSCAMTTPNLGTPSAIALTNATSFPTTTVTAGAYTSANITVGADGRLTAAANGSAGTAMVPLPQGRLTVTTGAPLLTVDAVAQGTLYYDCFKGGNQVPYYTGSADAIGTITSCEVSTAMQASSTGVLNTTSVFDVWWEGNTNHNICIATNGSGAGWAGDTGSPSNTARGTGYSQLDKTTRPYITNKNSVAHCYNGATDYGSIAANRLTYLGTIYTTASGKTGVALHPAGASGGSNPVVGVYNEYNRVPARSASRDTAANYAGTGTQLWGTTNASTANRITWVDGNQEIFVTVDNIQNVSAASSTAAIGVNFDSTSATPGGKIGQATGDSAISTEANDMVATDETYGLLGLHYVQAMELSISATVHFNVTGIGAGYGFQTLRWNGEY